MRRKYFKDEDWEELGKTKSPLKKLRKQVEYLGITLSVLDTETLMMDTSIGSRHTPTMRVDPPIAKQLEAICNYLEVDIVDEKEELTVRARKRGK